MNIFLDFDFDWSENVYLLCMHSRTQIKQRNIIECWLKRAITGFALSSELIAISNMTRTYTNYYITLFYLSTVWLKIGTQTSNRFKWNVNTTAKILVKSRIAMKQSHGKLYVNIAPVQSFILSVTPVTKW